MRLLDLILFLLKTLFEHGNLKIRVTTEGMNFPLKESDMEVTEWDGETELLMEFEG